MPAEPYSGSLDRPDDYRCVISEVPDPEGDGTWIRGYHFEPDKEEVVHHSILSAVAPRAAQDRRARRGRGRVGLHLLRTDRLAMQGISLRGRRVDAGPATDHPPGRDGMFLEPGRFLVNQVHYHYDHEVPARSVGHRARHVRPRSSTALEADGTPLRRLSGRTSINPAEGPCTPEEQGPLCDRETVLDDIEREVRNDAPGSSPMG